MLCWDSYSHDDCRDKYSSIHVMRDGKYRCRPLEYSSIHVVRDGTYRCRPLIPLNDGVRLDPNPANGSVDNLLPSRSKV